MIVRYFLVTLGLFLGLTACSGGKDTGTDDTDPTGDDDDDDDDDDNNPDTGDSGTGGGQFFEPYYLMIDASFAYDSQNLAIVDLNTAYGAIPSVIGIYLGEQAWEAQGFDFGSDAYCAIFLPLTNAAPAPWIADAGVWFGIDYDIADGVSTSCNTPDYPLDPNVWGTAADLGFASYGWGVGIGEIWPTYATLYSTGPYAEEILGGYINNVLLPAPEGVQGYVAAGRQINANYELITGQDGNLVLLTSAEVNLGNNNIATGHYILIPRYIWTFGG